MNIRGLFTGQSRTLIFKAGHGNDEIIVDRDAAGEIRGNGGAIAILGGVPTVLNTDRILAFGGSGNDLIRLDETNGPLPAALLFGGSGRDVLLGGSGNDTLFGGSGKDFIDGNRGADVAFLGSGDDVFRWDPGDGSDTIEGQSGFDEMLFNGSAGAELFTLAANGDRAVFTRDLGNIVMDINEVEKVTLNALAGSDTITIDALDGTDVKQINLNLGVAGAGDGAADKIFINDDGDFSVVNHGNGNFTILGLDADIHVTGFEVANDQLIINGDVFVF